MKALNYPKDISADGVPGNLFYHHPNQHLPRVQDTEMIIIQSLPRMMEELRISLSEPELCSFTDKCPYCLLSRRTAKQHYPPLLWGSAWNVETSSLQELCTCLPLGSQRRCIPSEEEEPGAICELQIDP